MTGRLLRAESFRDGTPPAGTAHTRVTLLTDAGLQQFVLEEADSVQVADPALRARIDMALATLRGATAHDTRHLALRGSGTGHRIVRVGYVAGAPLWKATYRLVLPAKAGDTARLQGWAVLENDTGSDWTDVELSLQYGNPVTFRQALYRSYYVQRPEVPVEVLGRLLPGVDTGGRPVAMAASAPSPARAMQKAAAGAEGMPMAMAAAAPMAEPEAPSAATEAAEATVFTLANPVMLAAGHSATVPILDRAVPAERVGVVQQGRPHPLAALRLVNDSGSSLPAGVLTLYDPLEAATFAGDARLGGLPNGETRLLEFAEDLKTAVDWQTDEAATLLGVTAAQGVPRSVIRRDRWTARVTVIAPTAEGRNLLVEIPRRGDGALTVEGETPATTQTDTAFRVPVALKPGERHTLVAHVDRRATEDIALLDDSFTLAAVLNEQALSATARAALRRIADLRTALTAHEAERDRLKAQAAEVEHDEDRLRRNIAAVSASDALHGKLVRALDADEDKLDSLDAAAAQADSAATQARAVLEQAVATLRLGD